jgi:RNA polymerase sigma-70 factor (ECF subfamily)
MGLEEDSLLVARLSNGDFKAFQTIYNSYWERMYTLAYLSLGVKEEAEDIIQGVFENLWKNRAQQQIRNLSTYLAVSVKNSTLNLIKSKISMRKYHEYMILQEIQEQNMTEKIINYEQLQAAIEKAMKHLPEKTIEVFKMSRFSNKSVKEIAEELNLSEKTIEYHITKSLKVLKSQLSEYKNLN